jgi:LPXTG-site transpeptidase (sortase) family protein
MKSAFLDEDDIKNLFGDSLSEPVLKNKPVSITQEDKFPKPAKKKWHLEFNFSKKKKVRELPDPLSLAETSIWKLFLRFLGVFILFFAISFTVANAPALILKMRYFWQVDVQHENWGINTVPQVAQNQESRLKIPKIDVDAPIIWNVPEDKIIDTLEDGLAHYEGTALPGQVGNVFITGHSSYYVWAGGSYKEIFALLNKLENGDKIYLSYKGVLFEYEVLGQKVVLPDNISVLDQTNDHTLSLMTCTPVGTNLRRLIITAKQVSN